MKRRTLLLFLFMSVGFSQTVRAELTLSKLFSDHMVLQRDTPIRVWGWATPHEAVSVSLGGSQATATADSLGRWDAYLPSMTAGGPYSLVIKGANADTVEFKDVLIGDVWVASGQSNMEMPLRGFADGSKIRNADKEIAAANFPKIRLLLVKKAFSAYPLDDLDSEVAWQECMPASAAPFSAVAYFFARDLYAAEKIPIGIIDSTWGGTPAESWMSLPTLTSDPGFMDVFSLYSDLMVSRSEALRAMEIERREDEAAAKAGLPLSKHPSHHNPAAWTPSFLFNGMIAPLTPLRIRGVIWYQGESSSDPRRAAAYLHLFSALIQDWRKAWHEGDFPFLFVQLANVHSDPESLLPVVRDAQRRALSLRNTAMVVTIDIGDPANVHYANKQDVGARLSLAARALSYHEELEWSGPLFRSLSRQGSQLRVEFDHVKELVAKDGPPMGFEIAGADRRFFPAEARIDKDSILIRSNSVDMPEYVRYGWENCPRLNLYNESGLPASPFTSEDFGDWMQSERFMQ
jgi:sialate O-acetylesterase